MAEKTQLSMTEAAKIVGVERSTLYRHITEKGISVIKREGSHPKIDVSELIRIYGDQVDPSRLKSNKKTNNDTKQPTNATSNDTKIINSLSDNERIKILEEERKREREQFQEQIDHLKDILSSEQEERRKITSLLTDKREDKSNSNEAWKESVKALESRIANQEKTAQEKQDLQASLDAEKTRLKKEEEKTEALAKEKEELKAQLEEKEKILKEEQEALELEKSKSFLHKLFGS